MAKDTNIFGLTVPRNDTNATQLLAWRGAIDIGWRHSLVADQAGLSALSATKT